MSGMAGLACGGLRARLGPSTQKASVAQMSKAAGIREADARARRPNSDGLTRQCLDQRKPTFGLAAHRVDPPSFLILAHYDVRAQRRKSLRLQLLQNRSKRGRHGSGHIMKKDDLKTCCQQIPAYFIWRGEETDVRRGGPWQRVARISCRAGAGQGRSEQSRRGEARERLRGRRPACLRRSSALPASRRDQSYCGAVAARGPRHDDAFDPWHRRFCGAPRPRLVEQPVEATFDKTPASPSVFSHSGF